MADPGEAIAGGGAVRLQHRLDTIPQPQVRVPHDRGHDPLGELLPRDPLSLADRTELRRAVGAPVGRALGIDRGEDAMAPFRSWNSWSNVYGVARLWVSSSQT